MCGKGERPLPSRRFRMGRARGPLRSAAGPFCRELGMSRASDAWPWTSSTMPWARNHPGAGVQKPFVSDLVPGAGGWAGTQGGLRRVSGRPGGVGRQLGLPWAPLTGPLRVFSPWGTSQSEWCKTCVVGTLTPSRAEPRACRCSGSVL